MLDRCRRFAILLLTSALAFAACSSDATPVADAVTDYPTPPTTPDGALPTDVIADIDSLIDSLPTGAPDLDALFRLGSANDPRLAWLFADLLRFVSASTPLGAGALDAWIANTGVVVVADRDVWGTTTNHLLAWDTAAPPGYREWKGRIFELVEPGWAPFFADEDADIDWRWLSWGGVRIDDRPLHLTQLDCPEGCIPALNDPATVLANTDDDWLADDRLVFGVEVNGEAVALPKNMMEVHEMINMNIGGRRVGIPYCTLCGSAQAYLTDVGNETYELRTSGLLTRSNKVMYEFHTRSVFDTFTGVALSGPLQDAGVVLEQVSVVTTTWGDWKADHRESFVLASDGGYGRSYLADPLRGRDDNGPIFPIGDVDPRLDVQAPIVGVVTIEGTAIAFDVAAAKAASDRGASIDETGVTLRTSGGGFIAIATDGIELATHQAFWFAWSQFHPDTELWTG
jgi:hypothetical protein